MSNDTNTAMWTYVGCENSHRGPALRLRYRFISGRRVWQKHITENVEVDYETVPRATMKIHQASTDMVNPYLVIEPGNLLCVHGWTDTVSEEEINRVNNDQKNREADARARRLVEARKQLALIKRDFPELLN